MVKDPKAITNLCDLVENEINLGFTFLETAQIAGSEDHRIQARQNSIAACETAERFMNRLPVDERRPSWATRLTELRNRLYARNPV